MFIEHQFLSQMIVSLLGEPMTLSRWREVIERKRSRSISENIQNSQKQSNFYFVYELRRYGYNRGDISYAFVSQQDHLKWQCLEEHTNGHKPLSMF